MQETWVLFLGWKDCLEKEMATHSSILAWRIPWMEEPGGLQSTGLNSPANAGDVSSIPGRGRSPGEGNDNPLQHSCLGNPMDRGAWWAAVYGGPNTKRLTTHKHGWAGVLETLGNQCFPTLGPSF